MENDPIQGPIHCLMPSEITLPVGARMVRMCPDHAAMWVYGFIDTISRVNGQYRESMLLTLVRYAADSEAVTA